jgi:nucleotide-sensitive chloride channel 1A
MPSVSPVSAVPSFVTPAEHVGLTGSTPSSFDSIPPILRYKKEKVSAVFDPSLDWFQDTRGMLYVIERWVMSNSICGWIKARYDSVLVFMSDDGHGFEIKYPAITLHAVSREQSGPCIYLQLNESEGAEDGEDDGMRELRLVPEGATDRSYSESSLDKRILTEEQSGLDF